ncbi:MAG: adenylosuccinate synthase [Candidatus Thermoplasmatota archaeon]|nr:adenylosuccinate synthase [Candidatus Thermoplasmatota archaeon]
MVATVVIGTQWGDEGKGKIVDYFAKDAEFVVRFQGGNNAGHTIVVDEDVYKLHIVPSGVIQGKKGVIGNGCVVDPVVLTDEIGMLEGRGVALNLFISDRAHVIMPYHKLLDGAEERLRGSKKIGTTKRGIGPCYSDKIARRGIRIGDLLDEKRLRNRLQKILPVKNAMFDAFKITTDVEEDELVQTYLSLGKKIKPYVIDTSYLLNDAFEKDKKVLFEGAQGTMLDVDFGTYPFTTSSHVIAGGVCSGAGVGPDKIGSVIGIVKAYTTRVGEGPLPTELFDDNGMHLRKKGHEFGTTTSRPRRCGWLDLMVVKHSCMLSGVTHLAITKLDVLNGLDEIKICTGYLLDGKKLDGFPSAIEDVNRVEPVFETFDGWKNIPDNPSGMNELPKEAKAYLSFIESYLGIPVHVVSTGPKRDETFVVNENK